MEHSTEKTYGEQTIVDRLIFWGKTDPDTPAFIFRGPETRYVLSRKGVLDLSSRFAYRLTEQGVKPGDVVCITLPNCPERIIVEYGVHLAGGVSMNGQVLRADGKDLSESLVKAKCKVIVLDKEQKNGAWDVLKQYFNVLASGTNFLSVQSDTIKNVSVLSTCTVNRNTNEFIDGLKNEKTFLYEHTKHSDLASIFTTSGSTGYSKLVKHSHRNILMCGLRLNEFINIKAPDKWYLASPLGWLGGFPLHYLCSGCTRVLLDAQPVSPDHLSSFLWKIFREENIEIAGLLPVHVGMMYELAKKESVRKRLKRILTGGQPVKRDFFRSLGVLTESFTLCYGATELGYITEMTVTEEEAKSFQNFSVGFPVGDVQIKIRREDNAIDKRGEILVKSGTLCQGYVDTQTNTESFLENGWFRTGDVGYLKEDGCLILEGRSSDAITHGAYILYPGWLEEKLVDCPGVQQLVIIPVPDPDLHHEICACVIREDDAKITKDDILTYSRRQLALDDSSLLNVLPKYVLFFDTFPLTVTTKLDRKTLIANATRELGL